MTRGSLLILLFVPICFNLSCNPAESGESKVIRDLPLEEPVVGSDVQEQAILEDTITIEVKENANINNDGNMSSSDESIPTKAKTPRKKKEYAQIRFMRDRYNFGNIEEGDTLLFKFDFINEGKQPLFIENVETSCGCTSLSYPKDPVQPKEYGKVEVVYNSLGKIGKQAPTITIITNSRKNRYSILQLEGVVYPKEDQQTEKE